MALISLYCSILCRYRSEFLGSLDRILSWSNSYAARFISARSSTSMSSARNSFWRNLKSSGKYPGRLVVGFTAADLPRSVRLVRSSSSWAGSFRMRSNSSKVMRPARRFSSSTSSRSFCRAYSESRLSSLSISSFFLEGTYV